MPAPLSAALWSTESTRLQINSRHIWKLTMNWQQWRQGEHTNRDLEKPSSRDSEKKKIQTAHLYLPFFFCVNCLHLYNTGELRPCSVFIRACQCGPEQCSHLHDEGKIFVEYAANPAPSQMQKCKSLQTQKLFIIFSCLSRKWAPSRQTQTRMKCWSCIFRLAQYLFPLACWPMLQRRWQTVGYMDTTAPHIIAPIILPPIHYYYYFIVICFKRWNKSADWSTCVWCDSDKRLLVSHALLRHVRLFW